MLKSEQIPMEVQDALNKAHGFIVSPQALASALNAWPGMSQIEENDSASIREMVAIILPLTEARDE